MIYVLSTLFTLAFVFYSKWQFSDDRGESQGKWHSSGMIMRMLAVASPFLCQLYPSEWQDYLLVGAINILLWELLINKIALNQKWLHVGTTAKTDIFLGKKKWLVYAVILLVTIVIKLFI